MKVKKDKGLAGIDVVIAIIAITIFSTLIISLIYNNVLENVKLKKEALAMIYITEIFENVGIQSFENQDLKQIETKMVEDQTEYVEIIAANSIVPQKVIDGYTVEMAVTTELEGVTNNEHILKKIKVKLTYQAGNKQYNCSMERMKIKE